MNTGWRVLPAFFKVRAKCFAAVALVSARFCAQLFLRQFCALRRVRAAGFFRNLQILLWQPLSSVPPKQTAETRRKPNPRGACACGKSRPGHR